MRRLVIPAVHVTTLRGHLLQEDEQERFAYVFCTRSGDDRLLVADVVTVPDEQMQTQGRTACRPDLAYEREQLQDCLSRGYQPLLMHSHAFSDHAGFSGQDLEAMDQYTDWLHHLYPEAEIGFGVLGRREVETTVYDPTDERFRQLPVTVIGNWTLDPSIPDDTQTTAVDTELYDRSIRLLTEEGQQRIAATTVGIVGVGGLGFILAEQLTRLGVKHLVVIDPDTVETSNLNRLVGVSRYDVGRPKVTVIEQQLQTLGMDVEVTAIEARVEDAVEALYPCDVIVSAADQVTAQSFLNEFCVRHLRYYIDAGTVIRTQGEAVTAIEGIVQLISPGATACYACLDRADPERARRERLSAEELAEEVEEGYIEDSALAPEPAVITLNGMIASQAASIVARLLAGYAPPPAMVRYEELETLLRALSTRRDTTCPVCGEHGLLAQGDREPSEHDPDPVDSSLDLSLATDGDGMADATVGTDDERNGVHQWLMDLLDSSERDTGTGHAEE